MTNSAVMTSRQASELDFAFARNGWDATHVKELSKGTKAGEVLDVLNGDAKIVWGKCIVDTRQGTSRTTLEDIAEHHAMNGIFAFFGGENWNPKLFKPVGNKLYRIWEQSAKTSVVPLNAYFHDFFEKYPHRIPGEWRTARKVIFSSTIFFHKFGSGHYCRCLVNYEGQWKSENFPILGVLGDGDWIVSNQG